MNNRGHTFHYVPYFSENYPIPAIVNVADLCNAYYDPDFYGDDTFLPGFVFGNEGACSAVPGSEDLVIDETVVRHEYTHFMMDWCGFGDQFDAQLTIMAGPWEREMQTFLHFSVPPLKTQRLVKWPGLGAQTAI